MNKTNTLLALIAVFSTVIGVATTSAYADDLVIGEGSDQIKVSTSISSVSFYDGSVNFEDSSEFFAIDWSLVSHLVDTDAFDWFFTSGNITYDESVPITTVAGGGEITIVDGDTGIITVEEFKDYLAGQTKDYNAAPSMSGFNTRDADRVTFYGLLEDPTFVMSNSEIKILNGKAIQRYIPVFFDSVLIDIIDVGISPSGVGHNTWIGIGGQTVDIPFGAYYEVTPEGKLLNHGDGYQSVFRDLNDMKVFQEDKDASAMSDGTSAQYRIYTELYGQ